MALRLLLSDFSDDKVAQIQVLKLSEFLGVEPALPLSRRASGEDIWSKLAECVASLNELWPKQIPLGAAVSCTTGKR